MSDKLLLDVRNLRTTFVQGGKETLAVDGIDFHLQEGETLGIVGESGSGKSVTALSLMRLTDFMPGAHSTGQVLLSENGDKFRNLPDLSTSAMRKVRGREMAMIFQEPMTSLNPVFRCGYQLAESLQLHRALSKQQAKEEALNWFERVHLQDPERIYRSYPHQISGGQKQRVMIAMAMACRPKVLIADEPTTALDVTVQRQVLMLMQELKTAYHTSMIFISHDLGVIAEVADRILVMQKGKIVEQGTVAEVFSAPKHPYSRALLACRPPLGRRLHRLPIINDFADGQSAQEVFARLDLPEQEVQARLDRLDRQLPILEVKELSTWFGDPEKGGVKAVDGVTFTVAPGETLGLVGESGSGKTTLGRTLLGLIPATKGTIHYKGQQLQNWRQYRMDFQMIFQDPYSSLNPRFPIGDAIAEALRMRHPKYNKQHLKDEVVLWLERVGLEADHYFRYPHQFSGGQRQRICIARALVVQPKFLVCDECVSALDISIQAQILNLLMDLRASYEFTSIFISHDLSVVKFMSDHMAVMQEGKIVEKGPADEIYRNPKADYTKGLIEAVPGRG